MDVPKKLSIDEIRTEVKWDGLDYALLSYCNPEHIEDSELAELWHLGQIILKAINKKLEI